MQLHTSSITTVEMTSPETSGTLEQRFALFGGMALLFTLALLMPGMAQPEHYHAFANQRGWLGVRTAIAVEQAHGSEGLREFYTALGTRYHPLGQPVGDIAVVKDALTECGFDTTLADRATTDEFDEALVASHHAGMDPVGDEVGTPVIRINGKSLFGPVISPAPKGEEAGELFDGVQKVTAYDGFFELKRTRTVDPIFD